MQVSQQALSQRLSSLPSELFAQVLMKVVPVCEQRWHERKRPLPPELAWAQQHYTRILSVDGSTLDALMKKTGLLKDLEKPPVGGQDACGVGCLHAPSCANLV